VWRLKGCPVPALLATDHRLDPGPRLDTTSQRGAGMPVLQEAVLPRQKQGTRQASKRSCLDKVPLLVHSSLTRLDSPCQPSRPPPPHPRPQSCHWCKNVATAEESDSVWPCPNAGCRFVYHSRHFPDGQPFQCIRCEKKCCCAYPACHSNDGQCIHEGDVLWTCSSCLDRRVKHRNKRMKTGGEQSPGGWGEAGRPHHQRDGNMANDDADDGTRKKADGGVMRRKRTAKPRKIGATPLPGALDDKPSAASAGRAAATASAAASAAAGASGTARQRKAKAVADASSLAGPVTAAAASPEEVRPMLDTEPMLVPPHYQPNGVPTNGGVPRSHLEAAWLDLNSDSDSCSRLRATFVRLVEADWLGLTQSAGQGGGVSLVPADIQPADVAALLDSISSLDSLLALVRMLSSGDQAALPTLIGMGRPILNSAEPMSMQITIELEQQQQQHFGQNSLAPSDSVKATICPPSGPDGAGPDCFILHGQHLPQGSNGAFVSLTLVNGSESCEVPVVRWEAPEGGQGRQLLVWLPDTSIELPGTGSSTARDASHYSKGGGGVDDFGSFAIAASKAAGSAPAEEGGLQSYDPAGCDVGQCALNNPTLPPLGRGPLRIRAVWQVGGSSSCCSALWSQPLEHATVVTHPFFPPPGEQSAGTHSASAGSKDTGSDSGSGWPGVHREGGECCCAGAVDEEAPGRGR
jgi:hypothetical protein